MTDDEMIALVDAPRLCGISYRRLWTAVVNGKIAAAERRGGQWFLPLREAQRLGKVERKRSLAARADAT
jgi:hypothetical protein